MVLITYIQHDGTEHQVQVETGESVMQGAVDNLVEGIIGDCGGACSCATCHCYVDEVWVDKIEPVGDMENELLKFAAEIKSNSRLSCQIKVTEELEGLVVHLPASQY